MKELRQSPGTDTHSLNPHTHTHAEEVGGTPQAFF